jgi:two-component system CheB/CheR fusion protein
LHYSLNTEGILILGSSETAGNSGILFNSTKAHLNIYKKNPTRLSGHSFAYPAGNSKINKCSDNKSDNKSTANSSAGSIHSIADQYILQTYSPPSLLINERGDIIHSSGRIGKYMEPAAGKVNWNIFALLREEWQPEFAKTFRKVIQQKAVSTAAYLKIHPDTKTPGITINIRRMDKQDALKGLLLVVFTDTQILFAREAGSSRQGRNTGRNAGSGKSDELKRSKLSLPSLNKTLINSQRELETVLKKEHQSHNEELQLINEELVACQEEMQSLNEELLILNAKLQEKLDENEKINNDYKNLLNNIDAAILFLDMELNIRNYTNKVSRIIRLTTSDIGRKFTDLVSGLKYPAFFSDARKVLLSLVPIEKNVSTTDDRWLTLRISPYCTLDDRVGGLVILFSHHSNNQL